MKKQPKTTEGTKLRDEQIANVCGGAANENATMNMDTFIQTLLAGGAANDPALAELVNAAVSQDWTRVGILLPQMIGNPLVQQAVNAAWSANG